MGTFITVAEVRRTSGIIATDINDADIEEMITTAESKAPQFLNCAIVPTEEIEVRDGNDTNRIVLYKNPLLAVRELKIHGTSITIDGNLDIDRPSGFIELDNSYGSPEETKFKKRTRGIVIRYLHGWVTKTSTETTTTSESSPGTSVVLDVSDESSFSEDDWVEVFGMDGNREVGQVTATGTNELTIDELALTHESGSKVVKVGVMETIKDLMRIVASISAVARIVGESAKDTTGYSLGELSVQKGEPYTQWRETANQLIRERDEIMSKINLRFSIQ